MKKLKKCWRALLTATVILSMLVMFVGCSEKLTPEEKYYEAKENITEVESETLDLVKDICKRAMDDKKITVKDMFIHAFFIDGGQFIEVNVLTYDGQYRIFDLETKYSGPLVSGLTHGAIPAGYENDTMRYLYSVIPELDGDVISFD